MQHHEIIKLPEMAASMNIKNRNMKMDSAEQLTLENLEVTPLTYGAVILNKEKLIEVLSESLNMEDLTSLKNRILMMLRYTKKRRLGFGYICWKRDNLN